MTIINTADVHKFTFVDSDVYIEFDGGYVLHMTWNWFCNNVEVV